MTDPLNDQYMQHGLLHKDNVAIDSQPSASTTPQFHTQPEEKRVPTPSADPSRHKTDSPLLHSPVTQVSLSAFRRLHDVDQSPPSSSGFSSQEHGSSLASQSPIDNHLPPIHQTALASEGRSETTSPITGSPTNEDFPDFNTSHKRTSSGQLKRSSITGIQDLKQGVNGNGRSRTSSILVNAGRGSVLDLSQQLRTRLSYAMVKVQNGWQSHTLDEVESLASSQASPRSSTSGFADAAKRRSWHSPRASITATLQRKSSSSESSEGTPVACLAGQNEGLTASEISSQSSKFSVSARRGLAPPADITSETRRRPLSNRSSNDFQMNGPHTPTRYHFMKAYPSIPRTPSQNAAMEADAVETLLFMASPGNSGYHPTTTLRSTAPTSLQASPLRSRFPMTNSPSPPRRRVSFADNASNGNRPHQLSSAAKDIEAMLDESDNESGDDLDVALSIARGKVPEALLNSDHSATSVWRLP